MNIVTNTWRGAVGIVTSAWCAAWRSRLNFLILALVSEQVVLVSALTDARHGLIFVWTIIALFCLGASAYLVWKRIRIRRYLMALPQEERGYVAMVRLTTAQERIASTGEVIQGTLRLGKSVALLMLGAISWLGEALPLFLRQWIGTVCILYLAVGLALILINDLQVDGRLEKDARNDKYTERTE